VSDPVPPPTDVRISAVVPTFGRRHLLPAVVEPLLAEPELHELVVAVDGSADGSLEWLRARAAADPRLVALALPNRGSAAARDAGVRRASGEVVLLLDDDVVAGPGLVGGHLRHHRERPGRLVLGYAPNDWRRLPPGRRGVARIYARAYGWAVERWEAAPDEVLLGLWTGNLSIDRATLLAVGLQAPAGAVRAQEDRELGLRLHAAGVRGVFDRRLRAEHRYDRSLAAFRRDCFEQGRGRRLVRHAHAELLATGPAARSEHTRASEGVGLGLPRPLRALVPALARDPVFGPVARVLGALFAAGVALRLLELEVLAARGLGTLETRRGVVAADRELAR
jgi:GT2 family glycosyltransferase